MTITQLVPPYNLTSGEKLTWQDLENRVLRILVIKGTANGITYVCGIELNTNNLFVLDEVFVK